MFHYTGFSNKRCFDDAYEFFQRQLYALYFTMEEGMSFVLPPPLLDLMLQSLTVSQIMPHILQPSKYAFLFNTEYSKTEVISMIQKKFPLEWAMVHPANAFHVVNVMNDKTYKWMLEKQVFETMEKTLFHRLCEKDIVLTKDTRESVIRLLKVMPIERVLADAFHLKPLFQDYEKILPFLDVLRQTCLIFLPVNFSATLPACSSMLIGYQDFKHVQGWIDSLKETITPSTVRFTPSLCEYGIAISATLFWVDHRPLTDILCFKVLHPQAFLEKDIFCPMFPTIRNALFYIKGGKAESQTTPMFSLLTHNVNDIHVFGEDASLEGMLEKDKLFNITYHTTSDAPSRLFYMHMNGVPSNTTQKRVREKDGSIVDNICKCAICTDPLLTTTETMHFDECGHVFCKSCVDRLENMHDNLKRCPTCRKVTFVHKLFFT